MYAFYFLSTRPTTITAGSDHYFHTDCPYVHASVSPSVPKLQNQAKITASPVTVLVGWPSGSLITPVLFFIHLHVRSGQYILGIYRIFCKN